MTTTTTLANTYQSFFSRDLLAHAVQATVLDQFAYKKDLPQRAGAKSIRFFRRAAAATGTDGHVAAVEILNEGTPIESFRQITYTPIDVPLVQRGEAARISDVASMTELFHSLRDSISLMGEECALECDAVTRDALVAGATTRMYAGGAASFAALGAGTPAAGRATALDFLRAATQLKIGRATGWQGYFMAVVPPQVSHDIQNDPDWAEAQNYAGSDARFRGELGRWAGCRFVEHTNPFVELSGGTEGTYNRSGTAAQSIFRVFVTGQGAYGTPKLEGTSSPLRPQVMICDQPDKSDPLNQFMTAGWKAYWAAKVLNADWVVSLAAKSQFAG